MASERGSSEKQCQRDFKVPPRCGLWRRYSGRCTWQLPPYATCNGPKRTKV